MTRARTPLFLLGASLALLGLAGEEHDHAHSAAAGERLGTVDFPVSCAPEAQEAFTRAVSLLHSFGYEAAREGFAAVAGRDPGCAMAHWGVAMSLYHPLWAPPTEAELAAGRAAAEKAAALGGSNERERGYIEAIGAFYGGGPAGGSHRDRAVAYEAAMGRLAARFPQDPEAAIFHALALLGAAPPGDPTFAQQRRAAAILERLLPAAPDHPGLAHYVIHAFDTPQLAPAALPAARRYAEIAPSSPHALHMPSHIFVRLGMWEESIASNLASAAAGRAWVARTRPGAVSFDSLHALDYLAYAYLQLGRDEEARGVVEEAAAATAFDETNLAAGYALAAIPARYALERRRWAEAAAMAPRPAGFPWARLPQAEATIHYARALGAARAGDPATARAALARLEAIHAGLAQAPVAGPYDWVRLVDGQRRAAAAWLAWAEGDRPAAVEQLGAAADLEDAAGKHPVTPGHVLPAREMLGEMLLELGRPAEALAAYERSLADSPNRLQGLAGALRAATAAGQAQRAAEFRARLASLAGAEALVRHGLAAGT